MILYKNPLLPKNFSKVCVCVCVYVAVCMQRKRAGDLASRPLDQQQKSMLPTLQTAGPNCFLLVSGYFSMS